MARYGFARILSHIGGIAANYTEPFYSSLNTEILPFLMESLAEKSDWDILYLSDVRQENKLFAECNGLLADKQFLCYIVQDHMNLAIDLSGGVDNYLSTISNKLKSDLRAKRKRAINEYGEIRLKEIGRQNEVALYFDKFIEFSLHSFNKREKKSSFENKRYSSFFREFLILMDKNARLDAHALFSGDKILAISFGYRFGKGLNLVLTGFDYKYKYVRPGYLLIEELIKETVRRKETYYNFYGYDRFYKSQWSNKQAPLYKIFVMRNSLRGRFHKILFQIEKSLRSNKAIVSFFRRD